MTDLLASEFLRARSRRVIPMTVVGILFGVLVGVVIGAIAADPAPSEAQLQRAHDRYERMHERCLDGELIPLEQTGFPTLEEFCAVSVTEDRFETGGLKFSDLDQLLANTASLVIMLGALLGATLGGADWSAGTMTTLLTWEPRRIRVLAARGLVIAGIVLALAVFAQVWLGLAVAGAVALKGTFALTPSGFVADLAVDVLRVAGVATLFAALGLSFATIGRSTVGAVSTFLGYLIVVEGFLAAWVWGVAKIALGRSATVVASGTPLSIPDPRPKQGATPEETMFVLQPGRAWLTLVCWTLVALVVAAEAFRRRDVT
jgi:ABC-type transport system involved in multi-copper enzyme maturation permease subunit